MTALRPAFATFAALILLLAITAASSRIDLGWANAAINLAIAVLKALLILLVFMQLRSDGSLPRLAVGVAALWLGILYVLTFTDYSTR